jgi:hypothetical protein
MALKIMKSFSRIIIFELMVLCFSCEDQGWYTDCSNCTTTEPDNATLSIKIEKIETPATINIYEGELEDSVLFSSSQQYGPDYTTVVGLNKRYTVTALYTIGNKSYTAVDSAIPRVKYTETQCEENCYYVYDNALDLRLKYTAKK